MTSRAKTSLILLPLLLLTACTVDRDSLQLVGLVADYIKGSNEKVPRETVAAIPYATMGLELGFTPEVVLVLNRATPNELEWYAGDQVYVATSAGRILRTIGLPLDLGARHPLLGAQNRPGEISYTVDFPDLGVFGAPALCTVTDQGPDSVDILGAAVPTRHTVEHCAVASMNWTFDNEFWSDPVNGYVWRSRQYVHPNLPPVMLETFRPEDLS